MPTVRSFRSAPRRYSPAEQLFLAHQEQLLGFIADRAGTDPHTTEDLAQETWLALLNTDQIADLAENDTALPLVLRRAARGVIFRHLTGSELWPEAPTAPVAIEADWERLTQVLGHTATWPAHWHQALAEHGQAALLRRAAADMASPPAAVSFMPAETELPAAA
ncbi:hypothetical protein [Streptomyces olivaceiscleroticus]|uniref:RNA polymerase sigma-70 region 2 domain-containing protein n=1 Tax=Streptomyces olivaceiscleroticus TaxID=68245 RepID=A0ABP3JI66_9ACTN